MSSNRIRSKTYFGIEDRIQVPILDFTLEEFSGELNEISLKSRIKSALVATIIPSLEECRKEKK